MKDSKIKVQHLLNQGWDDSKVLSKWAGIPLRTTQRNMERFSEKGYLQRKERSARKRKLNSNDRRRLVQLTRSLPMSAASDLRLKMIEKGSPGV